MINWLTDKEEQSRRTGARDETYTTELADSAKAALLVKRGRDEPKPLVSLWFPYPRKGVQIMAAMPMLPLMCLAVGLFLQGAFTPVMAQDAILPHGDPRLQTVEQQSPREKETHDQRFKQQGQGSSYRLDGVPQAVADTSSGSREAAGQQNAGLSDPSVNPGQAAGMKKFRGRILKSESNVHTIQLRTGKQANIEVDANTTGDKDLHVGDHISGKMTPQGRAITIHIDKPASKR